MITSFAEDVLFHITATVKSMSKEIEALHVAGYSDNFILIGGKFMSRNTFCHYQRQEFNLDKVLSWEEGVGTGGFYIYALSHSQENIKGLYMVVY